MDFQDIVNNLVDTFYRTDAEGNVVYISSAVVDTLGYTPDEMIGRKLSEFYVDPNDRNLFLASLDKGGSVTKDFEARLRCKDGHVIWVSTTSRMILDDDGTMLGVEGISRDITASKRLEEINTRLGRIVENSQSEIYVIDAQTLQFLLVNRGARENLGYSMQELSLMDPSSLQVGMSEEEFVRSLQPLRDGQASAIGLELTIQRKDGSQYAAIANIQLAADEIVPAFFAIVRDLTETKRVTSQLLQTQKYAAMHQLSGGVAHDFNNLLMVLQGNLELLNAKLEGDADKLANVEAALTGVYRATKLTQRLLSFSQQQFLNPQTHNINNVIKGMRGNLERTLSENIILSIQTESDSTLVNVDEGLLVSAILNLCINASEAMPDGGKLTLEVANTQFENNTGPFENGVSISVTDEGPGMSLTEQERIFEPFYSTKDNRSGTGLGLSMVHGFVQQSKGQIKVDSDLTKGTSITLHFPASPFDSSEPEIDSDVQPYPGGSEKILLIQGRNQSSNIVGEFLSSLGYDVHIASNGTAAKGMLDEGLIPAVLISDEHLAGDQDGYAIANSILKRIETCKVLMTSQKVQSNSPSRHTPYTLLTTPVPYALMASTIRSFLDKSS